MGQQLSKVQSEPIDDAGFNFDRIFSNSDKKIDISLYYPFNTFSSPTTNSIEPDHGDQISSFQIQFINKIQNNILFLTKLAQEEDTNTKPKETLLASADEFVADCCQKFRAEMEDVSANKQQLRASLIKKMKADTLTDLSIFVQSYIDSSSEDSTTVPARKTAYQTKQLTYFAIESLITILLILIKSAEKHDPTIIQRILTLTSQLCEQLPMNCLSSSNQDNFLFISLKPLIDYIEELSLTNDPMVTKLTRKTLLSFSVAKGSFKDLLPLLNELIFTPTDIDIGYEFNNTIK